MPPTSQVDTPSVCYPRASDNGLSRQAWPRSPRRGRRAMREAFTNHRFLPRTLKVIDQINAILEEYQAQGFSLTLRQLFYQFVARGIMPNTHKTYTYLGATLRDGRLAGLIDWDAIEDRTRETQRWMSWADPAERIGAAAEQYAEDPWAEHDVRLFVWIEKAALVNIVEGACSDWSVPYFAVRGY